MEKEFEALAEEIGFQQTKLIHANANKTDFVAVGLFENRKVLLKTAPASNKQKKAGYDKELTVEKIISQADILEKRVKVINVGQNENFCWILREYVEGESLCDYSSLKKTTLFGYDIISPKFRGESLSIIAMIHDLIEELQLVKLERPHQFSHRFLFELTRDNFGNITECGLNPKKAIRFYENVLSEYAGEINQVSCLNDLVLPNLIIDQNAKLYLSDFEWFSYDNYMTDVTFLWLFLWRYQEWQDFIVEKFIKTESDKLFFRASIIRFVINCKWHHRFLDFFRENKRAFIWYDYLIAAGESVDEIIKVAKNARLSQG